MTNNISASGKGKEGIRTAILLKTCSNMFQNSMRLLVRQQRKIQQRRPVKIERGIEEMWGDRVGGILAGSIDAHPFPAF
jgi:hypothetical protein